MRRALGLSLAALGLLLAGPVTGAAAEFEIAPEGFAVRMLDAEGQPEDRAGAHPDRLQIDFALNLEGSSARDLVFEFPPGFGVNAGAVPRCPRASVEAEEECPPESRVGSFEVVFAGGATTDLPLFELEPAPGQPVAIGTKPSFSLPVATELRPGDLGVTVRLSDLPAEPIAEGHLELWGVPADRQEGTSIPRRALLSAPSTCGPLLFGFETRSTEEEAPWLSASAEAGFLVGCESLAFEPGFGLSLGDPAADSPTGLLIDLSMPREASPSDRAQAQIKDVTVELPAGIGFSPGGAATLTACTDAQLSVGSSAAARCPPASRVGSIELFAAPIDGALRGTIYLGQERPGQRFRIFVVVPAFDSTLKLVGALAAPTSNGRLSAQLRGLPPLSISRIAIAFDGGPSALLVSPLVCGKLSGLAKFDPYGGGPSVDASAPVTISPLPPATQCAAPPFAPRLATAASSLKAGGSTSFSSTVSRRQGEQLPSRFSLTLPAGLSARLGTLRQCSAAAAAAMACPADSRMGSVRARIGSGPSTASLPGSLFLTGPYRRSSFGVAIEINAALGPFRLGSFSVRGGAEVDPRSGRLTVSTDPLPTAVEGVPIRFQSIELSIDRPGLVRNPTSCSRSSASARLQAQGGATASASSAFQARGCNRLGFRPKVRMTLLDRKQLHRRGRPGLRATVKLRPGGANLRAVTISLPPALGFALGGLKEICSHRDAAAGDCPATSRIGSAQAHTALLTEPLKGAIFVVQPRGGGLPDIWTSLHGGGIDVSLPGRVVVRDGSSAIELTGLPDLPLTSLAMRLQPGARGPLSLEARPCLRGEPRRFAAPVALVGQNAKRRSYDVRIGMKANCRAGSG